jgi:hypothetical protein
VGKGAEFQVLPVHPLPVIVHLHPAAAPLVDEHADLFSAGVDGVVQEFPYQGCGAVYHLAGGDLPGLLRGQHGDSTGAGPAFAAARGSGFYGG